MEKDFNFDELVGRARLGDQESMEQLAKLAEPRLRAYIYRTTLNDQLTGDMVQETLLEMIKSLNCLEKVESFWPWLFKTASSKVS